MSWLALSGRLGCASIIWISDYVVVLVTVLELAVSMILVVFDLRVWLTMRRMTGCLVSRCRGPFGRWAEVTWVGTVMANLRSTSGFLVVGVA